MSLWILDTDHVSLFQQNYPAIHQRVSTLNPQSIAVTIITFEEQMYGRLNRVRRANSKEELLRGYGNLKLTLDYFKSVYMIDFDRQAHEQFSDLVRQRIRIGTQDLRIAAIALARDGIIVTRNRKDFAKVPGLKIEDWTVS
jgi:tRNA(fMet)-specific endonuclease VapC